MAVILPKSRLPELLVCGKIRTGEKIVRIRAVFAWIFAVCALLLAQPALAQADLACSGLSHTLVVNWPQFGFTPCGGRSNPNEFILSPTTVPNLELKWHQLYGDGGSASPAVVNGVMYVDADFYSENLDYLYAVDANTGMVLWSKARGTQGPSSPAVANGLVFIGDLDNSVYAFDARTGAPVWKVTTGNEVWSSPTVANGIVYIISGDGNIYALDAAGGAVLWMKTVFGFGTFFTGDPAVAGGVVYIPASTSDASLYAVDAKTGAPRWSVNYGSMVRSSPAVANGVVYAGMDDGSLYALDANTGILHWKSPTLGTSMRAAAVGNGLVFVGATDGNDNPALYGINASNGAIVWKFLTGGIGYNLSSPAYANGVVYMPGGVGLYALDANTGAVLWQDLGPANSGGSPTVVNGVVYINSSGAYAYHLPGK